MKSSALLGQYIKRSIALDGKWYAFTLMCLIITGVARSAGADYIQVIVREMLAGNYAGFYLAMFVCCAIQLANYGFKFLSAFSCMRIKTNLTCEVRCDLLNKLNSISMPEFIKLNHGELQSLMRNDVQDAAGIIYVVLSRIGVSLFTALFTMVYMLRVNVVITVIVTAIVIIGGAINQRVLRELREIDKSAKDNQALLTRLIVSIYNAMDVSRIYGADKFVINMFSRKRDEYNAGMLKFANINSRRIAIYSMVSNAVLLGGTMIFAYTMADTGVTIEAMIAYIALSTQLLVAIEMIYRWAGNIQLSLSGWDRLNGVLGMADGEVASDKASAQSQSYAGLKSVSYRDLNYSYAEGEALLQNINIDIKEGMIYLIRGQSGSGKSTLFKCMMGMFKADSGKVQIDNRDVSAYAISRHTSYVPTDCNMLKGTVLENITMFDANVNADRVAAISRELDKGGWIDSLPQGYDTMLEEDGSDLSSGQKKLICIMRALYQDRKIFILDEPFASLDHEHRMALADALSRLKQEHIIVYTSHSIEDYMPCDACYELRDGRLCC